MDDLERWLRATMQAASQDPTQNLLTGVWRRRRTHLRRRAAGGAAALAAIAIAVPTVLASATSGPRAGPAAGPALRAAPGSELLKCGTSSDRGISGGEISPHWKAASIQAGPVWFVYGRTGLWQSSQRLPDGQLGNVGGVILAVSNGSTTEITTAQSSRFRFITADNASGAHTLHDGVPGITLVACPSYQIQPGIPDADAAGLTLFYLPLGYVTNLTGCLPMQIRTPPSWHVRWTADIPLHGTCRG